ncbi:hypothetical protein D3C78_743750 [compost metagenome]
MTEHADQPFIQRFGRGRESVEKGRKFLAGFLHQCPQQASLVTEVVEQAGLGDSRAAGDRAGGEGADALFGKQFAGGLQQALANARAGHAQSLSQSATRPPKVPT